MKKVLITGFDPFGGEKINPALEAVKRVQDKIGDLEIVKLEVPTVFYKSIDTVAIPTVFQKGPDAVYEAIQENQPNFVLCIGQAGGRSQVTPEWVGINFRNARIADNEGNQPLQTSVVENGPEAYFTMLPVFRMVEKMKENGIPASVSYTAGTYVCNDVMYSVLHYCHTEFKDVKGGFMHVPFATEQTVNQPAGTPGMNLKDIAKAIELSVEAMLESDTDIKVVSGETH